MSALERIRQAALDAGWTMRTRVGERHEYGHSGGTYDRDTFVIGRVDRHLKDGTPVTEPEHEIAVWYWHHAARKGQVRAASAHTFTVPDVIYRRGINTQRGERDKAERIIAALRARTSDIPEALA